eukprot:539482_1
MSQKANEWKDKLANSLEVEKLGTTENFYDIWSKDYEECLNQWGYTAPSKCASLLNEYVINKNNSRLKILDIGVGTGLVGEQILKYDKFKGSIFYGTDISKELLKIADSKSIYSKLSQIDFAKTPYPFPDNTFDCIVCIGVLTYCKNFPKVFNEWMRISKPGAIIVVSHRSDLMKKDVPYFHGMIATLKWKKLKHLVNQSYLPNNSNYASTLSVEFYVAQNTKKMSKL